MNHGAAEPQPAERGCVRRGPAAAAPKTRRHPSRSATSPAANPLRRVLRAHSRAPEKILAAREDFAAAWPPSDDQRIVANALLYVPEGRRRKLAGGKPAPRARPPVAPPNRPCPSGASNKFFGGVLPAAFPPTLVASGHFLRCPVGAQSDATRYPGAASAGADLPPANFLRRPSGTGTGRPRPSATQCGGRQNIPPLPCRPTRCDRGPAALRFGCGSAALYYNSSESSRAARILRSHRRPDQLAPNSSLPIPLPQIPLPNSAMLAAATSRAAIQITRVPPRPEHAPRDHRVGILRRSSPPSHSAFFPNSPVFPSAPPRSERFLKTPQRSERTQSGQGRKRAPRTHYGGCQSFASTLAPHALRVGCGSVALGSSCPSGPRGTCHCIGTATVTIPTTGLSLRAYRSSSAFGGSDAPERTCP